MLEKAEILESALTDCAAGHHDALRRIFDAEAGQLLAVARRIVRRSDLAEEVVQDAFVLIWTRSHQYAPERGSARGWIYAIVRNRALTVLRDGRRELTTDDEALAHARRDDEIEEADRAWDRLETGGRLRQCLEGLDEIKRRGILLAYVSGYTHGEIAGRLRVPLGTAKAWIRRGLVALRECME